MAETSIEWTDETWNPVLGCSPVSKGCLHCYAAKEAVRLAGNPNPKISVPYAGLAEMRGAGEKRRAVFTGALSFMHDRLEQPLQWLKSRRVFVNSMSDLFHPDVPIEFIAQVFAVMAMTRRHTYQVLTKRADRMAEVLGSELFRSEVEIAVALRLDGIHREMVWPLPNVWLGTSVEDQPAADERIPHLLRTPAAVRFLSCEPLLGPVDLRRIKITASLYADALGGRDTADWVIVGGESGPRARPCNVAWIRSIVQQCREAGTSVFVKQLGAVPVEVRPAPTRKWPDSEIEYGLKLRDRKGGNMEEWPADLRVREFPNATAGV